MIERVWSPTRAGLGRAARSRTALVSCALACLALAATAGEAGTGSTTSPVLASAAVGSSSDLAGTLGMAGVAGVSHGSVVDPTAAEQAAAEAARAEEERLAAEAAWRAANPTPVAGLNQMQMNNALKIVQAGQAMGLSKRAYVIAVATAMQESNLYNLASTRVAESWNYAYEGSGSDHDSVGLFQQRVSGSWGAVWQLMDPTYAATAFYSALVRVSGWESMALTRAAQKVQVSAYPNAYAKHESTAQAVVDALVPAP